MKNEDILKEMLVNISINTHSDPKDILVISKEPNLKDEIAIYPVDIHEANTTDEVGASSIDVAIVDSIEDVAKLALVLKDDGLVVIKGGDVYSDVDNNKVILKTLASEFKIVMISHFKDNQTMIIGSKKYHPTADINLQRADMLEKRGYYNADTQKASFVYNNYIETLYKGYLLK